MKAEYVDHMGSDDSVVDAARVSMDKTSDGYSDDENERLIHYLAKHNHWSPFAHTAITLRVSAPVPIRTQCMKHAVGMNINEESRRYISSRPEVFIPDVFRVAADGAKQGSGGVHPRSQRHIDKYAHETGRMVGIYEGMIQDGICPEQARLILPQGCMVNWIWTGNLASYARFYNQRTDPNAQQEVRELACMVASIIAPLYPVSWDALTGGPQG